MESPDPWDLADSTGFPTDEELRYRGEDPEIENGCPLCGKSLEDEPSEWDEENKTMVHSKCLKEAREYLASIDSDKSRSTNGGHPDELKPSDADPGSGLGPGEASGSSTIKHKKRSIK